MKVKIYGERNTGTNHLEDLVRLNLDCEVMPSNLPAVVKKFNRAIRKLPSGNLDERVMDLFHMLVFRNRMGWKHQMLPKAGPSANLADALFVLTIRDPYAWLYSMFKRPHNLGLKNSSPSFDEFLRLQLGTQLREKAGFSKYQCAAEMWNLKAKAMMSFAQATKSILIRHEDLVLQPEQELLKFSEFLNFPEGKSIQVPENSTKRDGRKRSDIAKVIQDKEWLSNYSQPDIEYVNQWLEPEVVKFFGYEIIESSQIEVEAE